MVVNENITDAFRSAIQNILPTAVIIYTSNATDNNIIELDAFTSVNNKLFNIVCKVEYTDNNYSLKSVQIAKTRPITVDNNNCLNGQLVDNFEAVENWFDESLDYIINDIHNIINKLTA